MPDIPENQEISYKQIKVAAEKLVSSNESNSNEISQLLQAELSAKQLEVQIHGQEQFLRLQEDWAGHIKWQIWAVLGFQLLFIAAIGFNVDGFTNNIKQLDGLYIGVILETLANIIALGLVVAKFLFPTVPGNIK